MAPTRSRKTLSKEAVLVRDLAEILDAQDLTEVELETEAMAIRISRQPAGQTVVTTAAAPMAAAPAAAPAAASEPAAEAAAETDFASHPGAVKSPMVGTAYESPEPGAAAFVTVGDTVKKGQTVLIIEAMKVMNPITAPQDGTVTHILVDNGQPVEFDQVLMVIA
ncbi:MAG: acetyl-CoA carboxylase biotin carboxyl carrier protein [Candidatus Puniceispirillaceae bacterium]